MRMVKNWSQIFSVRVIFWGMWHCSKVPVYKDTAEALEETEAWRLYPGRI